MKFSIYIDREDYKFVEIEEQNRFIRDILENMDVPLDECWPDDEYKVSTQDKIKFRHVLNMFDINIINDKDGGIKIYVGQELVAEWKKSTFEYKVDHGEINPAKKIFYQMNIECWSLFDEDN